MGIGEGSKAPLPGESTEPIVSIDEVCGTGLNSRLRLSKAIRAVLLPTSELGVIGLWLIEINFCLCPTAYRNDFLKFVV